MDGLAAAVQAAASGAGVVTPELLGSLVRSAAAERNGTNGRAQHAPRSPTASSRSCR